MKKSAYILSKLLFYAYLVLYMFIMIFSILSFFEFYYGVDVPFVEIIENYPKVHVPLLGLRINVPMNFAVLIMWLVMSYYALYFYYFKGFLKVFVKEKMFEYESLNRLRFFF